uniref:uncharacterized protein LOC118544064 n=1 Tax=Halichoerus grypus TaxID=9711 RepID=UPI0016590E2A|nr:uncharacterized protein LOC118544064 [Halichoerus grypus]
MVWLPPSCPGLRPPFQLLRKRNLERSRGEAGRSRKAVSAGARWAQCTPWCPALPAPPLLIWKSATFFPDGRMDNLTFRSLPQGPCTSRVSTHSSGCAHSSAADEAPGMGPSSRPPASPPRLYSGPPWIPTPANPASRLSWVLLLSLSLSLAGGPACSWRGPSQPERLPRALSSPPQISVGRGDPLTLETPETPADTGPSWLPCACCVSPTSQDCPSAEAHAARAPLARTGVLLSVSAGTAAAGLLGPHLCGPTWASVVTEERPSPGRWEGPQEGRAQSGWPVPRGHWASWLGKKREAALQARDLAPAWGCPRWSPL